MKVSKIKYTPEACSRIIACLGSATIGCETYITSGEVTPEERARYSGRNNAYLDCKRKLFESQRAMRGILTKVEAERLEKSIEDKIDVLNMRLRFASDTLEILDSYGKIEGYRYFQLLMML